MTSDSDTSRSSLSDASDADEGGHPLDAVLSARAASKQQAAGSGRDEAGPGPNSEPVSGGPSGKKRQREPEPPAAPPAKAARPAGAAGAASAAAAQRKRQRTPESGPESGEVAGGGSEGYDIDADIEAAATSEGEGSSEPSGYTSSSGTDESEDIDDAVEAKGPALPPAAPLGVIVVGEGEETAPNAEVRRLLRLPRYFDADYEEAGIRCFKCGGKGHMARDCTNPAKERPCFLCAQLGHDSRDCPNSLCFRCNRPGHMARDCPYGYSAGTWDDVGAPVCLRCGREDCPCAGQRDYVRAEGGCQGQYSRTDLQHVRCGDCRRKGHLSCKPAPTQPAKLSCHNCGEGGHTAEECYRDTTQLVSRERSGAGRAGSYAAQRSGSAAPSSSGYQGGYSSAYSGRSVQQQSYGGGYGGGGGGYGGGGGGGGYGGGRHGDVQPQRYGQAPHYAAYTYAPAIDQRYAGGGGQRYGGGQQQAQHAQRQQQQYEQEYDYSRGYTTGRGGRW